MTPQQAKTLAFLKSYSAERGGVMPSFDEIAEHIGIRSKSGVSRIMTALVDRGLIRRSSFARSVEIVETGTSDAVAAERERCANKAREFAAHYPEASDGRNTFIILAEWIEAGDRP